MEFLGENFISLFKKLFFYHASFKLFVCIYDILKFVVACVHIYICMCIQEIVIKRAQI